MKIWFISKEEDMDDWSALSNAEIVRNISEIRDCDLILKDIDSYINMLLISDYGISSTVYKGEDFWFAGPHDDIIEEIEKLAILEELNKEVLK
jgi:hypothetical protein